MTLKDFIKKGWTYIDDIDSLPDVYCINCDTRDFYVNVTDKQDKRKELPACWNGSYLKLLDDESCNEGYLINRDEILKFLKYIETISGGKNEWRCLLFNEPMPDETGWDFKYFRFYKYKLVPDKYIVTSAYGSPIQWKELTEETLGPKEYIAAY